MREEEKNMSTANLRATYTHQDTTRTRSNGGLKMSKNCSVAPLGRCQFDTSWPRGMTIIVLTFYCCRGRWFFLVNRKTRLQTLKTNRTSSAKLTHWNTQLKQNSVGTIDFCQTTKIYVQREQSTTRKEGERKREREKICHICQTQSKSSKRARNVKLMALNLHRNRRRHKQQQKKK